MPEKDRLTRSAAIRLEDPEARRPALAVLSCSALAEVVFPLDAETECKAALAGSVRAAAEKA